jgi:hypothetical protein
MAIRVYKDSAGNLRKENDLYMIGKYRIVYNPAQTHAGIYDYDSYSDFVKTQPIGEYLDESGTPYADATALERALEGLITMNIFDLLNDNNFALKVQLGQVRGVYSINKFGENPSIDTTSDPEDIWDFGGLYNFSTSAIIDTISGSDALDSINVTIEGLDANWDVVVQTVTLLGQTKVPLPTSLIRVYRAFNANGVNLLGDVYIYEDTAIVGGVPTDASKVRAFIKASANQTEMLIYPVPNGKTMAYMEGFIAISRAGGVSGTAGFVFLQRPFGKVFRVGRRIALNSQGSSNWRAVYTIPLILTEKSDVLFRCEEVSANDTGVSGGFQAFIFDNEIWGL